MVYGNGNSCRKKDGLNFPVDYLDDVYLVETGNSAM